MNNMNKYVLFVLGLIYNVTFDFMGTWRMPELFALLISISTLRFIVRLSNKTVVSFFVLLSIILLFKLCSYLINQSSFVDMSRGLAVIIFCMLSTAALMYFLRGNPSNIYWYLGGMILSIVLFSSAWFDFSAVLRNQNIFKSKYVGPLNYAVIILLFKSREYRLLVIIFGGILIVLFNIYFGARSNALIWLGTIISYTLIKINYSVQAKAVVFGLILIGSFQLYKGYVAFELSRKPIGGSNSVVQLSEIENKNNPILLLLRGRAEVIMLFDAFTDKPFFGHGSWGKDETGKYALKLSQLKGESDSDYKPGYIVAHSVILGYLAYGGIFVGLLIFGVYVILLRSAARLLKYRIINQQNISIILLYFISDTIWAFLFSPIGTLRTTFPIFSALILSLIIHVNFSEKNSLNINNDR